MDPLTELLTGLGRHYGLVLVGCAELIAALFLLGWRPRERRGRERLTAVSPVDRLMLSELYRQEEQVCLVLRRSDRMPLQAIGNLEGLLGVTLDCLRETMDALFSGLDRPVDGADFWRKYENWGGLRDLCREMKMSSGQWLRLTVRRPGHPGPDRRTDRGSRRGGDGLYHPGLSVGPGLPPLPVRPGAAE